MLANGREYRDAANGSKGLINLPPKIDLDPTDRFLLHVPEPPSARGAKPRQTKDLQHAKTDASNCCTRLAGRSKIIDFLAGTRSRGPLPGAITRACRQRNLESQSAAGQAGRGVVPRDGSDPETKRSAGQQPGYNWSIRSTTVVYLGRMPSRFNRSGTRPLIAWTGYRLLPLLSRTSS